MENSVLRAKVEATLEKIREGLKSEGGDIDLIDVREATDM